MKELIRKIKDFISDMKDPYVDIYEVEEERNEILAAYKSISIGANFFNKDWVVLYKRLIECIEEGEYNYFYFKLEKYLKNSLNSSASDNKKKEIVVENFVNKACEYGSEIAKKLEHPNILAAYNYFELCGERNAVKELLHRCTRSISNNITNEQKLKINGILTRIEEASKKFEKSAVDWYIKYIKESASRLDDDMKWRDEIIDGGVEKKRFYMFLHGYDWTNKNEKRKEYIKVLDNYMKKMENKCTDLVKEFTAEGRNMYNEAKGFNINNKDDVDKLLISYRILLSQNIYLKGGIKKGNLTKRDDKLDGVLLDMEKLVYERYIMPKSKEIIKKIDDAQINNCKIEDWPTKRLELRPLLIELEELNDLFLETSYDLRSTETAIYRQKMKGYIEKFNTMDLKYKLHLGEKIDKFYKKRKGKFTIDDLAEASRLVDEIEKNIYLEKSRTYKSFFSFLNDYRDNMILKKMKKIEEVIKVLTKKLNGSIEWAEAVKEDLDKFEFDGGLEDKKLSNADTYRQMKKSLVENLKKAKEDDKEGQNEIDTRVKSNNNIVNIEIDDEEDEDVKYQMYRDVLLRKETKYKNIPSFKVGEGKKFEDVIKENMDLRAEPGVGSEREIEMDDFTIEEALEWGFTILEPEHKFTEMKGIRLCIYDEKPALAIIGTDGRIAFVYKKNGKLDLTLKNNDENIEPYLHFTRGDLSVSRFMLQSNEYLFEKAYHKKYEMLYDLNCMLKEFFKQEDIYARNIELKKFDRMLSRSSIKDDMLKMFKVGANAALKHGVKASIEEKENIQNQNQNQNVTIERLDKDPEIIDMDDLENLNIDEIKTGYENQNIIIEEDKKDKYPLKVNNFVKENGIKRNDNYDEDTDKNKETNNVGNEKQIKIDEENVSSPADIDSFSFEPGNDNRTLDEQNTGFGFGDTNNLLSRESQIEDSTAKVDKRLYDDNRQAIKIELNQLVNDIANNAVEKAESDARKKEIEIEEQKLQAETAAAKNKLREFAEEKSKQLIKDFKGVIGDLNAAQEQKLQAASRNFVDEIIKEYTEREKAEAELKQTESDARKTEIEIEEQKLQAASMNFVDTIIDEGMKKVQAETEARSKVSSLKEKGAQRQELQDASRNFVDTIIDEGMKDVQAEERLREFAEEKSKQLIKDFKVVIGDLSAAQEQELQDASRNFVGTIIDEGMKDVQAEERLIELADKLQNKVRQDRKALLDNKDLLSLEISEHSLDKTIADTERVVKELELRSAAKENINVEIPKRTTNRTVKNGMGVKSSVSKNEQRLKEKEYKDFKERLGDNIVLLFLQSSEAKKQLENGYKNPNLSLEEYRLRMQEWERRIKAIKSNKYTQKIKTELDRKKMKIDQLEQNEKKTNRKNDKVKKEELYKKFVSEYKNLLESDKKTLNIWCKDDRISVGTFKSKIAGLEENLKRNNQRKQIVLKKISNQNSAKNATGTRSRVISSKVGAKSSKTNAKVRV